MALHKKRLQMMLSAGTLTLIKTIAKKLTILRRFATYLPVWFESNQKQLRANLRLQKQRVKTVLLLLLRWPKCLQRRNNVRLKVYLK